MVRTADSVFIRKVSLIQSVFHRETPLYFFFSLSADAATAFTQHWAWDWVSVSMTHVKQCRSLGLPHTLLTPDQPLAIGPGGFSSGSLNLAPLLLPCRPEMLCLQVHPSPHCTFGSLGHFSCSSGHAPG